MRRALVGGLGLLALIQLVPYDHTNLPVVAEPARDSTETRELAVRACFDCHSNETVWACIEHRPDVLGAATRCR
ncbi:MAG: heme-binding domain-containing protein [Acidimicrobiia bacterium]